MQFKDYYEILGVPRDASADAIKKAFRQLARKYHPDVSKAPDAEARMKEINEANAVLSDAERRAAYDQLLARGARGGQEFEPPPGWDAGFEFSGRGFPDGESADFSDFFAELFGRMGGAAFRVGEHRVGLVDLLHARLGVRRLGDVRVVLARKLPESLLDRVG